MAIDFFAVPTATFRILFRFFVLAHDRRRVVHFNVTAHPTTEWTARQVVQAFPEETAPRFVLRDRDNVYGERFRQAIEGLGVEEVVMAARSPWQNPYAERLIGSLRRDCLDHVIVLDEVHLRRILAKYFDYYNETRCHLSLQGDAPAPRVVQTRGEQGGRASPGARTSPSIRTSGGVTSGRAIVPVVRDGVLGNHGDGELMIPVPAVPRPAAPGSYSRARRTFATASSPTRLPMATPTSVELR